MERRRSLDVSRAVGTARGHAGRMGRWRSFKLGIFAAIALGSIMLSGLGRSGPSQSGTPLEERIDVIIESQTRRRGLSQLPLAPPRWFELRAKVDVVDGSSLPSWRSATYKGCCHSCRTCRPSKRRVKHRRCTRKHESARSSMKTLARRGFSNRSEGDHFVDGWAVHAVRSG